jgi:hypothetical protein
MNYANSKIALQKFGNNRIEDSFNAVYKVNCIKINKEVKANKTFIVV